MRAIMSPSMTFIIFHIHTRYNSLLFAIFFFLAFFIVVEIIEDRSCVLITMERFQHLFSFLWRNLLGVPAISNRLILIIFQSNVTQLSIGYIFNINPLNLELSFKLILYPNTRRSV